eukprot:scaffold7934_cov59-Attheya_sp.AAC.3
MPSLPVTTTSESFHLVWDGSATSMQVSAGRHALWTMIENEYPTMSRLLHYLWYYHQGYLAMCQYHRASNYSVDMHTVAFVVVADWYFIPKDGDRGMHPNVFLAPKAAQPGYPPLLGQVKDIFPLEGSPIISDARLPWFWGGAIGRAVTVDPTCWCGWIVWMIHSPWLRVWKNAILAKVTRIHLHDNSHHGNNKNMMMMGMDNDSDDDPEFRGVCVSMSSPPTTSSPLPYLSPPPTDHYLLGVFDEAPAPAASLSHHSSQPRGGIGGSLILAIGV